MVILQVLPAAGDAAADKNVAQIRQSALSSRANLAFALRFSRPVWLKRRCRQLEQKPKLRDNCFMKSLTFDRAVSYYDRTRALPREVSDALTDALIELGQLQPGRRCLEVGVGTGRIALPLVARGVDLVGVDLSSAMLARLASKWPHAQPRPGRCGLFALSRPLIRCRLDGPRAPRYRRMEGRASGGATRGAAWRPVTARVEQPPAGRHRQPPGRALPRHRRSRRRLVGSAWRTATRGRTGLLGRARVAQRGNRSGALAGRFHACRPHPIAARSGLVGHVAAFR